MRMVDFSEGGGIKLAIPIWASDLEGVPEKYNLDDMTYFHAGINGVANIVLLSWQNVLRKLLPISTGVSLFRWAIRNFTNKPYGGIIKARAKNRDHIKNIVVTHNQLYEATAIPVVATARILLENSCEDYGYHFMGEWVDHSLFIRFLKDLGLGITINE